jgi:L-rhamnose mutarotase
MTRVAFTMKLKPGFEAEYRRRHDMKKWWKYISDLMECNPDNSPVVVPLREVFHMD